MDDETTAAPDTADSPPVINAEGLAVVGEHGPLFSDVDLQLRPGFHAIQMPGGPAQHTLLLSLAGRLKPTRGTVTVNGATGPRGIRKHCAIAAFADIDDLEDMVTVQTVLTEQRRWVSPFPAWVPVQSDVPEMTAVFGDDLPLLSPKTFIIELSDLELFLLRITLALMSDRPVLIVGDLEQVRDNERRALAVQRLGALAEHRTVVVGVTNPLGDDAPDHVLHDRRIHTGKA